MVPPVYQVKTKVNKLTKLFTSSLVFSTPPLFQHFILTNV